MRYVSFCRPDGTPSFGRLSNGRIVDLGQGGATATLKRALTLDILASLADGQSYALADITLLPVIPDPDRIICIGVNYDAHRKETGRPEALHPTVFTRWNHSLVADGAELVRPRESECFDYEGELAVVIGQAGRRIARSDALSHIAGYSIFNDASVRDWQRHTSQFTPGKNFPATGAFGPALVTPDEAGQLDPQHLITRLNGVIVQDQPISDMIFDIPAIIEYVSSFTPLSPGDVIATGTPGGVGDKRVPPLYMKPGDKVEVEIGVIGTLQNHIVDECPDIAR